MESNERPPPRASPGSLRLPSPPLRPPGRRPVRRLLPSAEAQAHPQTPQRTPEPERGGEKARGRRARNSLSRVLAPGEPGPSGRGGARSLALCTDGPETTRAWRKLRSQRERVRTGRRPEQRGLTACGVPREAAARGRPSAEGAATRMHPEAERRPRVARGGASPETPPARGRQRARDPSRARPGAGPSAAGAEGSRADPHLPHALSGLTGSALAALSSQSFEVCARIKGPCATPDSVGTERGTHPEDGECLLHRSGSRCLLPAPETRDRT